MLERLDVLHKWLRPSGLLVLAASVGPDEGVGIDDFNRALADWDIDRRERFEQDPVGAWRRSEDFAAAGVVLITATPRS